MKRGESRGVHAGQKWWSTLDSLVGLVTHPLGSLFAIVVLSPVDTLYSVVFPVVVDDLVFQVGFISVIVLCTLFETRLSADCNQSL